MRQRPCGGVALRAIRDRVAALRGVTGQTSRIDAEIERLMAEISDMQISRMQDSLEDTYILYESNQARLSHAQMDSQADSKAANQAAKNPAKIESKNEADIDQHPSNM